MQCLDSRESTAHHVPPFAALLHPSLRLVWPRLCWIFQLAMRERKILRQLPLAVLGFGLINYRIPLTFSQQSGSRFRSACSRRPNERLKAQTCLAFHFLLDNRLSSYMSFAALLWHCWQHKTIPNENDMMCTPRSGLTRADGYRLSDYWLRISPTLTEASLAWQIATH